MTVPLHSVPAPARERAHLLGSPVRYRDGRADPVTEVLAPTLAEHHDLVGALPQLGRDELVAVLAENRLTGCGGSHFPVAAKWRALDRAVDVVVANGAESEPLSRKDAALLELRPHLVLDGLELAARATGARRTVLWLHEDAHPVRSAVTRTLAERTGHGRSGLRVDVAVGPRRYLTGESSAVIRALSGGPALPTFRRAQGGRSTLVHNVETLARIALVARGVEVPSRLLTVASGRDRVVVEPSSAVLLREAVRSAVGPTQPESVLLGGYGGQWWHWRDVAHRPVVELPLGAGVVLPVTADACGLRLAAQIARYLAAQGARQCGPCMFGLPAIARDLDALVSGRASSRDLRRLGRHRGEVSGRGGCHHPDGAVAMVASALDVFAADVVAHLRGRCSATAVPT